MDQQRAIKSMISPGMKRAGKPRGGVIQIHVTRNCDKACFGCTQGSNLRGNDGFISLYNFTTAVLSLKEYFGVVGIFGGNPALHPQFPELCEILKRHIPKERCGLWCNKPFGHGSIMRTTFNPSVSNLNVHLDKEAYREFKNAWPESRPFGLNDDSRHSPPYVAMKDVVVDEGKRWELISNCDINKHWSAMVAEFRGELRAWFCEIAGAQSILHQHEADYPDTGLPIRQDGKTNFNYVDIHGSHPTTDYWWKFPMSVFEEQVLKHCHECGVPLKGYGNLSQTEVGVEQVSETHKGIYEPKRKGRGVQIVTTSEQLGKTLTKFTHYMQNAKK